MAFPVHAVTRPAVLAGQHNGRLDEDILVTVPGQDGGPEVRLVPPAARAWRALCAAALAAGHTLKSTGGPDSYRPFDVQKKIFLERYTKTVLPGRPSKVWKGDRYYQKPKTAEAAVPGTSNHGWGLAVDTGEERDHDSGTERLSKKGLAWLVANEETYGFSHEVQSEPWHIRYFAGDHAPAAVVEAEPSSLISSNEIEDDMPLTNDDVVKTWSQDGIIDNPHWRADAATNPKIKPASAVELAMDEAHAASTKADQILTAVAAVAKTNAAMLAAIQALSQKEGVDTASVLAAINTVGTTESTEVASLQAQISLLRAQVATLAAAAQAAVAHPGAPAQPVPAQAGPGAAG
jgi:hypothetical protein